MSRYYGEMTDAINDLAENLQADLICSQRGKTGSGLTFPQYPQSLHDAMVYLANELNRLSPLAEMIDQYMLNEASLAEVMWCYKKAIQPPSSSGNPLSSIAG